MSTTAPTESKKTKPFSWPEAKLGPDESNFISICCRRKSINWALHRRGEEGSVNDYNPVFIWRTPHLLPEDVAMTDTKSLNQSLVIYLPESVKDKVLESDDKFREGVFTFYVTCSNKQQLEYLTKLLESIPSRIFIMSPQDFFTKEQGLFDGMGADQTAIARGAMSVSGVPTLVIDAEDTLTYTGVDEEGVIIGSGISLGFESKMNSISSLINKEKMFEMEPVVSANGGSTVEATNNTGKIITPPRNVKVVNVKETQTKLDKQSLIQQVEKSFQQPHSLFTTTPKSDSSLLSNLLHEVSCNLLGIFTSWIKIVKPGTKNKKRKKNLTDFKSNDGRTVIVSGTWGEVLEKSMPSLNSSPLVEGSKILATNDGDFMFKNTKGLVHFGITEILYMKSMNGHKSTFIKDAPSSTPKKAKKGGVPDSYIGKKVAKTNSKDDSKFRGEVKSFKVVDAKLLFRVVYADGDEEDVEEDDLKLMIEKFDELDKLDKLEKKPADPEKKPNHYIGKRVGKYFGDDLFFGVVKSFEDNYFSVVYDDGDNEDMDAQELLESVELHSKNKEKDTATKYAIN